MPKKTKQPPSTKQPEEWVNLQNGTGQIKAEVEAKTPRDCVAVARAILQSWGGYNGEREMMRVRRLLRRAQEQLP